MTSEQGIDRLAKSFIVTAFINFGAGATLGAWMALVPGEWDRFGPIHGEINPYGWLTLLIYGMTYAVFSISTGLRPPWGWVGWLQLGTAELGLLSIVAGDLGKRGDLVEVGFFLQATAPILFLGNILSAVFYGRRRNRVEHPGVAGGESDRTATVPAAMAFLSRSPEHKATDRVARRGTDLALMIFIVATWWMETTRMVHHHLAPAGEPAAGHLLVYYGWIGGTVLAVALHLYPRLTGTAKISAGFAAIGQAAWLIPLVLVAIGQVWIPTVTVPGSRMLGFAIAWAAAGYLWTLRFRKRDAEGLRRMPPQSVLAWYGSWAFAFALGILLLAGLNPESLAAVHLLFLSWITTLAYGIGYSLFPLFLQRRSPRPTWGFLQLACSMTGAGLMAAAFLWTEFAPTGWHEGAAVLLAIGGTLAWLGAFAFLSAWLLMRRA